MNVHITINFITHNDSGDDPKLYEFNDRGELLKFTRFYSILNRDWEDITFDGEKYFIADVGNNYGTRKNLTIYIIDNKLNIYDSIKINYKNQKSFDYLKLNEFDAEALISIEDSLALFSKNRKTLSTEVSGFKEIPTFLLNDLIFLIELIRSIVASGCIVMMSAPASAKFLMKL